MGNSDSKTNNTQETISGLIKRLLVKGTQKQFLLFFHRYHEADIADALKDMSLEDQKLFFYRVKPELAAEVLEEMDVTFQLNLITEIKTERAAKFIEEMEPDEAVDLLEDLFLEDETKAEEIIDALPEEDAEDIRELLSYEEGTAGALMTSEYTWIPENLTVKQAVKSFRAQKPPDSEVSFYIFIVDEASHLVGYTTIRELVLSDLTQRVQEVRKDYPVKVQASMDQEEVAKLFQKYDVVVMPVLDDEDCLVGIITVDDVVDVVVEEATEDLYKLSGTSDIGESKLLHGKVVYAIWSRIPWLLMTVFGGIIASYVMKIYAENLPIVSLVPLALSLSFVPLLMGLGGNVGNQSATIIVRALATGELRENESFVIIAREVFVGLCIGVSLGGIVFLSLLLMDHSSPFSLIVSASIVLNSLLAALIGSSLPIIFKKFNIDPAIASAPFISTSLDIIGQIVYFVLTMGAILYWFT
ncbi:magnesium transporter [Candidatus Marinamargulisbacteria bacterium SCGC AG-439-L15]|nr:magnesium transporter [Candidatus Marinamargulisbacteria bacterium SCGC AG-439-L15]